VSDSRRAALPLFNFALAIAMGAFGAHALKGQVSDYGLEVFGTAKDYHLWVGAVWVAIAFSAVSARVWRWLRWTLGIGTVLFCGSLYMLAVTDIKIFGAITPLGGATWIVSFCVLGYLAWQGKLTGSPDGGIG